MQPITRHPPSARGLRQAGAGAAVDDRDRAYLAAHAAAAHLLATGEIRAYAVSYHPDRGRCITVETPQGWDPWPLFCEHWPALERCAEL